MLSRSQSTRTKLPSVGPTLSASSSIFCRATSCRSARPCHIYINSCLPTKRLHSLAQSTSPSPSSFFYVLLILASALSGEVYQPLLWQEKNVDNNQPVNLLHDSTGQLFLHLSHLRLPHRHPTYVFVAVPDHSRHLLGQPLNQGNEVA